MQYFIESKLVNLWVMLQQEPLGTFVLLQIADVTVLSNSPSNMLYSFHWISIFLAFWLRCAVTLLTMALSTVEYVSHTDETSHLVDLLSSLK